ncbi:MAG: hypothetical protein SP1CHLAM54_17230 [Chlamydiia bacterium]|nr:hypothetical protein [Chlamydiia bacterium]MCH9616611.1 hypothetical protein [Chlamydiia bacterium]MCH9629341.1 hypothetical protein [Chlamydiia bacterium]
MVNPIGPSNHAHEVGQSGSAPDLQQIQSTLTSLDAHNPPVVNDQTIKELMALSNEVIQQLGGNFPIAQKAQTPKEVSVQGIEQLQEGLQNYPTHAEKVVAFHNLCVGSLNAVNKLLND